MKEITKEHVLNAIKKIENEGLELIPSTRWLVEINSKEYPPKEVMRYAHEQMDGKREWTKSGGYETNSYLEKMGFIITEKISDPIKKMIEKYKNNIKKNRLQDELFKWELLGEFQGKPDLKAKDFADEIKNVDYGNLMYKMGKAVLKHLAEEKPEEYRKCFETLFDEKIPLVSRMNLFSKDILKIYREIQPNKNRSHHHDERTMATFLTFHNPDKYTFYKDAFYKEYCKILGIQSSKAGEKYDHYLKLVDDLIDNYIKDDLELISLINDIIPKEYFQDSNHKILAQDILFQSFDKKNENGRSYWRIGTKIDDTSYWEIMKNNNKVCIGWSDIGNLNEKYIESRKDIIPFLENAGYYVGKKSTLSRKSGEIYNFYKDIKIGDIVLAQEGESVLGIGIVSGDYNFEDHVKNAHQKSIEWISEDPKMNNKEGLQTTCYKLTDSDLIKKVDRFLNSENKTSINLIENLKMSIPLNQILYGPPGTGKTYKTILKAAEIIEEREITDYEEAKKIFKNNLHERIEFITFHQNYSYEDFIQGLRPDTVNESELTFAKKDGVFKKLADKAHKNMLESRKPYDELKREAEFDEALAKFIDKVEESEEKYRINKSSYISKVEEDAFRYDGEKWTSYKNGILMKFSDLREFFKNGVKSRADIKNLKTISASAKSDYTYYFLVYEKILEQLPKKVDAPDKVKERNYVIVIDEINRANISRVFGELITLIEEDKRSDGKIPMEAKLPSGDTFVVPSNLYIIGTMNTADKSIALLDIALRRRFEFEALYPDHDLDGIHDKEILRVLNNLIIEKKGHDFQIGHSYFMNENNDLVKRMNKKVIPLLLEYFMNDKKEVEDILDKAGLVVNKDKWPLEITGKK